MRLLVVGMAAALAVSMPASAWAKDIAVSYGPEATVYGSCRPALTLVNRSTTAIDYAQIDMRYRLRDGRTVEAAHKSRYRDGLDDPIPPGGTRLLVIHHDESVPFSAPCRDIVGAQVVGLSCDTVAPGHCTQLIDLAPGDSLALPQR